MKHYVDHLETEGAAGYLETTSMKNVDFYQNFGFVVQHEEHGLGTPNWYMWKPGPR